MPAKLDRLNPHTLSGNPRATLSSWLRYEPLVLAAYNLHPKLYVYEPQNRTASTVCSQLRDAVRGRLAFGYPSSLSDADLSRWYSEVIFRHDGKQVFIGPKEMVLENLEGVGTAPAQGDASFSFETLTFEEVCAFTLLLSTGRIKGPVIITSPPDLSLIPDRINVARLDRPDGSIVLL